MAYKGEVVLWHRKKGFGFVKCPDFDEDLFVHHSAFGSGDLIEGKELTFDVEDDSRGAKKRCTNVEGDAIDKSGPSREGGGGGRPDDSRRGHVARDSRDGDRRRDSRDRDYDRRDRRRDSRDRDYDRRRDSRDSRDRYERRGRDDSRDRGYDRRRDSRDRY